MDGTRSSAGFPGPAPAVVVFDVNETLSDMGPMSRRFREIGTDAHTATTWFTAVLRDGFALAAAGGSQPFAAVAEGVLRFVLADAPLTCSLDEAVENVMSGFLDLPVHPDVPDGIRSLAAAGRRLVTLTNGSIRITQRLLTGAGLAGHFERMLSVEDAGVWKPASAAYRYASRTCGAEPSEMLMVAVHPWDIDGAARAGLRTAWLDRQGRPYPGYFRAPDISVTDLRQLAGLMA